MIEEITSLSGIYEERFLTGFGREEPALSELPFSAGLVEKVTSEQESAPKIRGRKRGRAMGELPAETLSAMSAQARAAQVGVTTLDRVHAAMLLQAGGQANALRALIKAEQDRGPDFLRLADALSALYPSAARNLETELRQILQHLGLTGKITID